MKEEIMVPSKINIVEKFSKLPQSDYETRIIAKLNDYEIRVVKFKGDFVWHIHSDTDEVFIILKGTLTMHFRDKVVDVNPGEMIVVPKGVEHKPTSKNGYEGLLIEPEGVSNTGDSEGEMTLKKIEWI